MEAKSYCQNCVFGKQKTCELNRYEAFEKNGAKIDRNDEGYGIINGRYCSAFRPEKWADRKDRFNLPIIARAELLISTEVIIYIDNDNYSDDKLLTTLNNLKNQLLKPNQIVLLVNKDRANYHKMISLIKEVNLKYRLDRILPEEDGSRINSLDAIDIAMKKNETDYYLVINPGQTVEDNEFFANIDEALNEKLIRFSIISGNNKRGAFISSNLHKKLYGNAPVSEFWLNEEKSGSKEVVFNSLIEKIYYLAEKDNHQLFIKTYEEINGN